MQMEEEPSALVITKNNDAKLNDLIRRVKSEEASEVQ
jgi:hypothetical protein